MSLWLDWRTSYFWKCSGASQRKMHTQLQKVKVEKSTHVKTCYGVSSVLRMGKVYFLHQSHSRLNFLNSDFSFHRYHAGRDRDLCLQDACWDNALYPFTRAFQGDDFQYSLAVTLITFFFSVGYIVLTQPWLHFPWNDNSILHLQFLKF